MQNDTKGSSGCSTKSSSGCSSSSSSSSRKIRTSHIVVVVQ